MNENLVWSVKNGAEDTNGQGKDGRNGDKGVGLNFIWNGTQLGVKREDEGTYQYVNLKGEEGAKGETGQQGQTGPKGEDGKNLEFLWNGTSLGIRQQGTTVYSFVDLKGPRGENGIQGAKGDKGDTGPQGLKGDQGVKGDKGDKISHQWQGTILKLENPDGTFEAGVDLRGLKGDKGDVGERGPQGIQGVQGPAGNGQSYVVFQRYFIATEGQQNFSWSDGYVYPVGINAIAVYINGMRIGNKAFVETSGSSIQIKRPLNNGEVVFIEAMQAVKDLQGPQGPRGIPGPKGDKGDKGDQGIKGDTGLQGPKGDTGATGERGPQGLKGDQGIQGIQGLKGDKGEQGVQGPKGDTGSQGPPGTTDYNNLMNKPTSLPANGGNADTVGGLYTINLQFYQSNRDFANGTFIQTDIDYSSQNGEPFLLEIQGNSYGSLIPFDIKFQGYIYSNTVINYGGISNGTNLNGMSLFNYNGKLCFWFPRQSYWQGFSVFINSSYGGIKKNRLVAISDSGKPSNITKEVSIALNQSWHSGNLTRLSQLENDIGGGTQIITSNYQPSGHVNGRVWIQLI